jgi:hypothetical protein
LGFGRDGDGDDVGDVVRVGSEVGVVGLDDEMTDGFLGGARLRSLFEGVVGFCLAIKVSRRTVGLQDTG